MAETAGKKNCYIESAEFLPVYWQFTFPRMSTEIIDPFFTRLPHAHTHIHTEIDHLIMLTCSSGQ